MEVVAWEHDMGSGFPHRHVFRSQLHILLMYTHNVIRVHTILNRLVRVTKTAHLPGHGLAATNAHSTVVLEACAVRASTDPNTAPATAASDAHATTARQCSSSGPQGLWTTLTESVTLYKERKIANMNAPHDPPRKFFQKSKTLTKDKKPAMCIGLAQPPCHSRR